MSLSRESPFLLKVVYSVDDGCSLRHCLEIDPPRARKYHVVLEYSRVKWPSSLFTSVTANVLKLIIELASKSLWVKINLLLHWENKNLLVSRSTPSPIKCLVTKLQTKQNVYQVLLYVRTGMKNTGLKMPGADQIYVQVGCSFY